MNSETKKYQAELKTQSLSLSFLNTGNREDQVKEEIEIKRLLEEKDLLEKAYKIIFSENIKILEENEKLKKDISIIQEQKTNFQNLLLSIENYLTPIGKTKIIS